MDCQGSNLASAMRYAVPEYDPEQCQWEPRPVSGVEPQDDHNSPRGGCGHFLGLSK